MKLPRFTAKTPPPRETGLARAQDIGALTRTGGAEFEAIAGAGRAIQQAAAIGAQAYMDRQALDDQQKMGEISIKAQEAEKQGVDSIGLINMVESRPLPDDPDYYKGDKIPDSETWAKSNESVFADYKKRIISLSTAIKNPKTRQRWINTQLVRGSDNFGGISRAKYDEYQQHTILSYARTAASNGDIELANKWIKIAEKHGLIGPKRAAAERINNIKEHVAGLSNAKDFGAARDVVEESNLPETQKRELNKKIAADERAAKDKALIVREAYLNETHKLTMDTLAEDINDLSSLEKLPDDLKSYWQNKLGDRDKMIKAGRGDSFINVYDPARYNSFRTIMEQDPKNLKESQIVDAVGYGLTIEQGIDLIERHRKLSRKDSPLTAPEAKRSVKRITNAFEDGVIKHPDFIEDAIPDSEDEYKNNLLRDQIIDEHEEWLKEKPRTPEEIREYTSQVLAPYEEAEGESFMSRIIGNFSYQAFAFSNKEYRDAIESLNKEAQAEWKYIDKTSGKGFWKLKVLPDDFLRKWQSPNKILTPQIARIYKKWAHDDLEKAKAMAQKDGWREPKSDFGLRVDNTKKGKGFLGELPIVSPEGKTGVATEFSISVEIDGKEIQIPTLVPTLTQEEIDLMTNDIIPNNKPIPEKIRQKAITHAKKRMKQNKSVFLE